VSTRPEQHNPLRVTEVIESQIGQPRNNESPGRGLNKIPLRLNRDATGLGAG
jgi:hypothetical protein